jgi:hypothetical protein
VARRLRAKATSERDPGRRLSSFAIEHEVAGDLGHIHATHDLTALPVVAAPGRARPLVLRLRRFARRAIYPVPEAQATWNGAAARVISFLLHQLAAQARAVESLERQVAALQSDRPSRKDE